MLFPQRKVPALLPQCCAPPWNPLHTTYRNDQHQTDLLHMLFHYNQKGRVYLNNPARRVGRGFHCSRQDFSPRAVLESRFSPALRFSWLLRHLSVLRKTGTWLLQCRPSTPTLYHTIDTHPESGNKRARFTVTNLYCYRVTLTIDWQIPYYCKCLYQFAAFVIRKLWHIPYFHFSG